MLRKTHQNCVFTLFYLGEKGGHTEVQKFPQEGQQTYNSSAFTPLPWVALSSLVNMGQHSEHQGQVVGKGWGLISYTFPSLFLELILIYYFFFFSLVNKPIAGTFMSS